MSRNLYVSCPFCDVSENVYSGQLDSELFDLDGEFISTRCKACRESGR